MSLIRSLEIENFQSHELTKLDLHKGLNVIVGPSDQGKSALIRALRWLCYNEPKGTDFFRVGANFCRVKLVLDTSEEIIRERTSSKNRYIYCNPKGEETVFEGFGNTIPWEIVEVLQMSKVSLDADSELALNISQQLEGPFLLNEKGSLRAKMIGRLTGVHIIDVAIREVARDLSSQQQEEKRLTKQLEEISEKLSQYDYLPDLQVAIVKQEELQKKLLSSSQQLQKIKEMRQKWELLQLQEQQCQQMLNSLQKIEEAKDLISQAELLSERRKFLKKLVTQYRQIIEDEKKTESFLIQLAEIELEEKKLEKAEKILQRKSNLLELKKRIDKWKEEYMQIKKVWNKVEKLEISEKNIFLLEKKIEHYNLLKNIQTNWQSTELEIKHQSKEKEKLEKKFSQFLAEYQRKLQEKGQCPLCFSQVDENVLQNILNNYH